MAAVVPSSKPSPKRASTPETSSCHTEWTRLAWCRVSRESRRTPSISPPLARHAYNRAIERAVAIAPTAGFSAACISRLLNAWSGASTIGGLQ
jgi:hypothetical protein